MSSGVATGVKGSRVSPLTAKILPKIGKEREKIRKKWEKREKNQEKNREGSFTLPLLTDRAGYGTGSEYNFLECNERMFFILTQ